MPSRLITSTIQSCILNATSNLIAQLLTAHKSNTPYIISWRPVFEFALFQALSCPPNFLWQSYLETTFPSTHPVPTKSALLAASTSNEKELDREQKSDSILEPKLSVPNTLCKFILDQTLGSAINTIIFSLYFAGVKGMRYNEAWETALEEFWPLMISGWKVWPAISLLNFAVVKKAETRMLIGSLAGLWWGIYLSLAMS